MLQLGDILYVLAVETYTESNSTYALGAALPSRRSVAVLVLVQVSEDGERCSLILLPVTYRKQGIVTRLPHTHRINFLQDNVALLMLHRSPSFRGSGLLKPIAALSPPVVSTLGMGRNATRVALISMARQL